MITAIKIMKPKLIELFDFVLLNPLPKQFKKKKDVFLKILNTMLAS